MSDPLAFNLTDINHAVSIIPNTSFSPIEIAKQTDIPLQITFRHLLSLVDKGNLSLSWKVYCSCGREIIDNLQMPPYAKIKCQCGKLIKKSPYNVLPVFSIKKRPVFLTLVRNH